MDQTNFLPAIGNVANCSIHLDNAFLFQQLLNAPNTDFQQIHPVDPKDLEIASLKTQIAQMQQLQMDVTLKLEDCEKEKADQKHETDQQLNFMKQKLNDTENKVSTLVGNACVLKNKKDVYKNAAINASTKIDTMGSDLAQIVQKAISNRLGNLETRISNISKCQDGAIEKVEKMLAEKIANDLNNNIVKLNHTKLCLQLYEQVQMKQSALIEQLSKKLDDECAMQKLYRDIQNDRYNNLTGLIETKASTINRNIYNTLDTMFKESHDIQANNARLVLQKIGETHLKEKTQTQNDELKLLINELHNIRANHNEQISENSSIVKELTENNSELFQRLLEAKVTFDVRMAKMKDEKNEAIAAFTTQQNNIKALLTSTAPLPFLTESKEDESKAVESKTDRSKTAEVPSKKPRIETRSVTTKNRTVN